MAQKSYEELKRDLLKIHEQIVALEPELKFNEEVKQLIESQKFTGYEREYNELKNLMFSVSRRIPDFLDTCDFLKRRMNKRSGI